MARKISVKISISNVTRLRLKVLSAREWISFYTCVRQINVVIFFI